MGTFPALLLRDDISWTQIFDNTLEGRFPSHLPTHCEVQRFHFDPASRLLRQHDYTAEAFGSIDILVNCAGIARYTEFLELPLAEWQVVQDVNSTGTFLMAQAVARHMVTSHPEGRTRAIVNIASVEAHVVLASEGHPQVHYNASKGAVHMITRALAVELASHGIRVNSICPGLTDTPLASFALSNAEKRASIEKLVPLGRVGQPGEIAAAALFLASEDASYITGEALVVDGGFMVQ